MHLLTPVPARVPLARHDATAGRLPQNSFADIAQLLSEFFRDLDVVPSDIIAGLVLLRRVQKLERNNIVKSVSARASGGSARGAVRGLAGCR